MRPVAIRALALLLLMTPGLGQADAKAGAKKAELCLLCHKPDNQAAWVPLLERQTREYLYNQIKAYKERRRPNLVMQTNTASLSERDIRDIADFFASRSPLRVSYPLDAAKLGRGKLKAEALKCASCHGQDYAGRKETPRLAGLDPRYGARQIVDFADGKRPHPAAQTMRAFTEADAEDLAQYFAQLE